MDLSILDNFQLVQSPVSTRRLNFDEFNDASTPMETTYCRQLTENEFEATGEQETDKALNALAEHLKNDPSAFLKLVKKRKVEEMENAGFLSMLKCRLMTTLKGDSYVDSLLSEEEYQRRLNELINGMMVVQNYSKESRRFSQRLAERQSKRSKLDTAGADSTPVLCRRGLHAASTAALSESTASLTELTAASTKPTAVPPPPPLPPPPPPLPPQLSSNLTAPKTTPLKEILVNCVVTSQQSTNPAAVKLTKTKMRSCTGVTSVHQELMSCNPIKRLRNTQVPRSPGGTPVLNPSKMDQSTGSLKWSSHLDSPEPLHAALLRVLNEKFRNVRSPGSPAASGDPQSPESFSP